MLDRLLHAVDPATLFALRAGATVPLLLLMLKLTGRDVALELRRVARHRLHWLRGAAWSATALLVILSFWNTPSLTETYALMLLHPLWTLLLAGAVTGDRQSWRPYAGCLGVLLGGLTLYGFGNGIDLMSPASYLMPIAAGVAFALTNLVGVRIKRELRHDAVTKTVGATLAALLAAPAVLLLAPWLAGFERGPGLEIAHDGMAAGSFYAAVLAASAIALLANLGISHAFDRATSAAPVAAIDTAIILFGFVIDAAFTADFEIRTWLGPQGLGMVAMTTGAAWAAARLEGAGGRRARAHLYGTSMGPAAIIAARKPGFPRIPAVPGPRGRLRP
jgi:drug/metabolite transporter (DMT)-like permease